MDVSVIILAFNEERHIARCLTALKSLEAKKIIVVDCFSRDRTAEIAGAHHAEVVLHEWPGAQSAQFNWALENLPIETEWVLRLDADEYLTEELVDELKVCVPSLPAHVTGLVFPRYNVFLGKRMRRGTGTVKILRMFRRGKALSEARLMDEHICLLQGESRECRSYFVDHNLNGIGAWTDKHNNYSLREAVELLDVKYGLFDRIKTEPQGRVVSGESGVGRSKNNAEEQRRGGKTEGLGEQAAAKRQMKMRYARAPLFWRALVYFFMRYVVRGGFLEGKVGFMWHFFQGLWYRMLVDVKIWEIERLAGVKDAQDPALALQGTLLEYYGVDCHAKNPFERPVRQAAGQRNAATKDVEGGGTQ